MRFFAVVLVVFAISGTACGTTETAHRSTTRDRTDPGDVRQRMIPVLPCATQEGGGEQSPTYIPSVLPAITSGTAAKRLAFYSNGLSSALAPTVWACSALNAANGSANLTVYPPGQPPNTERAPQVTVIREYTAHLPGAFLVCPYFADSQARRLAEDSASGSCALPEGTAVTHPTPDIAQYTTAAGGRGVVIYPGAADSSGGDGNVAAEECVLPDNRELCATILTDFTSRTAPGHQNP